MQMVPWMDMGIGVYSAPTCGWGCGWVERGLRGGFVGVQRTRMEAAAWKRGSESEEIIWDVSEVAISASHPVKLKAPFSRGSRSSNWYGTAVPLCEERIFAGYHWRRVRGK